MTEHSTDEERRSPQAGVPMNTEPTDTTALGAQIAEAMRLSDYPEDWWPAPAGEAYLRRADAVLAVVRPELDALRRTIAEKDAEITQLQTRWIERDTEFNIMRARAEAAERTIADATHDGTCPAWALSKARCTCWKSRTSVPAPQPTAGTNAEARDKAWAELTLLVRDTSADHHGNGPLSLSGSEAARLAEKILDSNWLAEHDAEVRTSVPAPQPIRIEDMTPGTTFTARSDLRLHSEERRWFIYAAPGHPRQVINAQGVGNIAADRIDPSTIRDVQPAPEVEQ